MTLDFFVKTNNLLDFTIHQIDYQNGSLFLTLSTDLDMHYIANGCRSEFVDTVTHTYEFLNQEEVEKSDQVNYIMDYSYLNGILHLKCTHGEIKIKNCEIKVK